jgi:phenylacetate-CoA ligase
MAGRYWDEEIETMAPAGVAALEAARLAEQMAYVHAASPVYRACFDAAGIGPGAVRRREDLALLPFTEKRDLAEAQRDGTLIGGHRCAPREDIVRIQATGGTTGTPMRIAFTRRDIADYCEMGARALWTMGCRPGDIVFECMNYNLYAGGLSDHLTFEHLGAATIPFGVGNSQRLVEMIASLEDEVAIWATPSYAVRLAQVAEEAGLVPRDLGLRKGFFSGEAGMQIPEYRRRIEETWGLRAADQYGTGELGMHSGECEHRGGVHYGGNGFVLTELIDPETTAPIAFEEGAVGEFVYTSIRRQASPLLRMRSHDLMQVFTEPCPCGRTGFRFKVLGRSDDMFIVKGVNVFPLAVQATVAALQPALTGEFRIVLDRAPPIDYPPRLIAEVAAGLPAARHAETAAALRAAVAQRHNFTAAVELVPEGGIASEKKTRRLIRAYLGETES